MKGLERERFIYVTIGCDCLSLFFKTVPNHSPYFHSAAFHSISGQIRQCWKFGRNLSLATHTSIILQNCDQPLTVLSFHCISLHFRANQTMLKIWSEFIFGHSYLHYSSKLWSTTLSLSILSFSCILLHFKVNQTMLKIWSEFIFWHSYFCCSAKLWPTT